MLISLCNEVVRELSLQQQCLFARKLGYDGMEIAPFTLGDDPHLLPGTRRAELRMAAGDAGIAITSLHYLLLSPNGTFDHFERPRPASAHYRRHAPPAWPRRRSWRPRSRHGSPGQRQLETSRKRDAASTAPKCFAAVAEEAARCRCHLLHRAVGAAGQPFHPHGGGGRIHRACHCASGGENDDRLLRCRPRRGAVHPRPDPPAASDGPHRPHSPQRPEPPGPGEGDLEFAPILRALEQADTRAWRRSSLSSTCPTGRAAQLEPSATSVEAIGSGLRAPSHTKQAWAPRWPRIRGDDGLGPWDADRVGERPCPYPASKYSHPV